MIYPFKGINDHEIVRDKDSYNNQIVFGAKNSRMNELGHLAFTTSIAPRDRVKKQTAERTLNFGANRSQIFNKGVIIHGQC